MHEEEGRQLTNRSDVRFFTRFIESVESAENFQNRHMKVMLTLSTDGYKPKRISRREIWPLYLRIDDLRTRQANEFMNTIFCYSIFCSREPSENLISAPFSRLYMELRSLGENPIVIEYEGKV
ncbi:hypothetical protein Q1695_006859 [Nippostrongylus brasiliensis]|nr:hypothetical protein Q1695_006859 [Nippostrongylus brasiliensis]